MLTRTKHKVQIPLQQTIRWGFKSWESTQITLSSIYHHQTLKVLYMLVPDVVHPKKVPLTLYLSMSA